MPREFLLQHAAKVRISSAIGQRDGKRSAHAGPRGRASSQQERVVLAFGCAGSCNALNDAGLAIKRIHPVESSAKPARCMLAVVPRFQDRVPFKCAARFHTPESL